MTAQIWAVVSEHVSVPCELTWPLWFIHKNPPEGFAGEYNPEQCTVTATPSLLLVLGPQELKEVGVDVVTLRESWAWSRDPSSSAFLPSVSHPCPLNPRFLHLGCAADFNLCCTIPFIQPRLRPGAVCQPCLWIVFLCVYLWMCQMPTKNNSSASLGEKPHLNCKSLLCEASGFYCKSLEEPKDVKWDLLSFWKAGKAPQG